MAARAPSRAGHALGRGRPWDQRGLRFLGNHLSNRFTNATKRPSYAFITIESICNSRCGYCDMWKTKRGDQPTTEEWKTIIDDIRALGTVTLTFSGGEPFLNPDLFELAAYARSVGLTTMVVTNLSLFRDAWVEKISESFDFFGTSIDSTRPEGYVETRGVDWLGRNKASIHKIMDGLASMRSDTTVCAMVTVSNRNSYEMHDLLHMVFDDLKMDGISFNMLDPQGGRRAKDFAPSPEQVAYYKQVILDHKGVFPITNSARYLKQAGNFDYRCNPWKCIQIDHEGKLVAPCLFIDGGKFDLRETRLTDVWRADTTQAIYAAYEKCKTCNLGCVVESSWSTYDFGFVLNESLRGVILPGMRRIQARNEGRLESRPCPFEYSPRPAPELDSSAPFHMVS